MGAMRIVAFAPDLTAERAFELVSAFDEYSAHSEAVLSVALVESGPSTLTSTWEVQFRRGILCWTERAVLQPARGTITFDQIDGDVDEFRGHWTVTQRPGGVEVEFGVTFDVGIPTLEHIIDPIAEDALHENLSSILHGMLGPATRIIAAEGESGRTWVT